MKPTVKTDAINELLNDMMGTKRVDSITNNTCTSCKKEATKFRDELSKKEFSISGFCQKCQDSVFGV